MDYGLAKDLQFNSLLKILYILPAVVYGQLLPLEDAEYDEQVAKGVHNRSVRLACGNIVQPLVVFWSFTKPGSLIPRAVAISNGLESKVEKASAVLGEISLRNSTLEIKKLQQAAEGHFMCQAMYEVDGEIKVAYFYIELLVLVPVPKPFLQINNSTPVEGMPVVMICTVKEGTPPIAYTWQRYTNRDGMVVLAEAGMDFLNLTSANRTYMGWYTCTAHNEVNSQTSDGMYLDVIYGPDEPVISIEPFAINQHGFSANEQEEVIMTCLAPSNPPSHYIWFYNSSQVYSGQKYVIARISRTQTGIYTCLAQNMHLNTRTQATIILTVYYLPKGQLKCMSLPASNFQDLALHCLWPGGFPSVQLRWVKSRAEETDMGSFSRAIQIHQGADISNGTSYICLASHPALRKDAICRTTVCGEPQVTLWWRDWRHHVLGSMKPSYNVFVMKPNATLGGKTFTCMAAHPLWARTAECHIRLEPPRIMVQWSQVSLFEGSEVQLACFLQGAYLVSEVFWYNNKNQPITASARKYHLQQENAWFNLTLQDTEWIRDSGTYRCAAINAVGNASATISLQVKKYPNPPNVTISRLMYTRPRTEVELEWETRGSGNLTGFIVQRREAKKTGPKQVASSWETVANNIDPDVRGRKLGGLDPAVAYAFRILAVNHRTTGHPSEVKTPADPPFNAYPVVIGAALAGMVVATVISLLVFQYIVRNRENNPRLHDLLFRMAGAETREQIGTPEDAEMPTGISDAANEQVEEASEQVGETSTTTPAEAIQKEAVVSSEDPTGAQEEVPAPSLPSEDPVNVTITVTATP
ncbi:V-set and immunoglobulin domain-containing protein 10-like 2 [Pantherophis guttatus]|uniref:V-set and immunoglobulin domain-containing protein 10-like 2 n=1 Tax=Pantherophis guttatus TaxID=94885 RepID=UPI00295BE650|nr:V-set and immunoglobulin domain-containing protein 10-like 2 [Pantherophis guttatus]